MLNVAPAIAFVAACTVALAVPQRQRIPLLKETGRHLFVASDGISGNPGTIDRPMDLHSAFTIAGPVRSGDTVWLRGGRYRGPFVVTTNGTDGAPITYRQQAGERVILDGTGGAMTNVVTVLGSWLTFEGFEITHSQSMRAHANPGSTPPDGFGTAMKIEGPNIRAINLVIHDSANGFAFWPAATDSELTGNIVFNNGWDAPDRGHGHGMYVQNRFGAKLISHNVVFNQFSHGIHAWGTTEQFVDNVKLIGNVAFNNGLLSKRGAARNILVGADGPSYDATVESNYTYYPADEGENNVGYAGGCIYGTVRHNYFAGGFPLSVNCARSTVRENTLYGRISPSLVSEHPANTFLTVRPRENVIFVRKHPYTQKSALLVIYNWELRRIVGVDLARAGFTAGDLYEVVDVQNYFGGPLQTGTYTGKDVRLPMTGTRVTEPVGTVAIAPRHTAPEFAVFIVRRPVAMRR